MTAPASSKAAAEAGAVIWDGNVGFSAPASSKAAADGLTIGRRALHQLHTTLLRDAPDAAYAILQETGFAAGEGLYQAFCAWLPGETGVTRPDELDAGRLTDVLSAFFR